MPAATHGRAALRGENASDGEGLGPGAQGARERPAENRDISRKKSDLQSRRKVAFLADNWLLCGMIVLMALRKGSGWIVRVNGCVAIAKHSTRDAAEQTAARLRGKARRGVRWYHNGHAVQPTDVFHIEEVPEGSK